MKLLWTFANTLERKVAESESGSRVQERQKALRLELAKARPRMSLNVFDSQWNMKCLQNFLVFFFMHLLCLSHLAQWNVKNIHFHISLTQLPSLWQEGPTSALADPPWARSAQAENSAGHSLSAFSDKVSGDVMCVWSRVAAQAMQKIVSRKNAAMTMEQSLSFNHSMLYLYTNYLLRNIWTENILISVTCWRNATSGCFGAGLPWTGLAARWGR